MGKDSNVTVQRLIEAVRKGFGAGAAIRLSEGQACEVSEVIPTGISVLDHYVLGIGGLPVGRVVELYGEEGCGKTATALQACASCQREGGVAVWAETEEAFQRERAVTFGVDPDQLVMLQPASIEETGQQIETLLKAMPAKAGPLLVAWDSIAATPTVAEVEDGLQGNDRVGVRAKALSRICRALVSLAVEKRACLMFVNQVREKIGVMFGDRYTTPGGHAVKFHASVRLQLFSGKALKDTKTNEHLGKAVTFLAAKNRMAPPWRKAQVRLLYATGWDDSWSTITYCKDRDLISKQAKLCAATYDEALSKTGWPRPPGNAGVTDATEEDSQELVDSSES